MVEITDVPKRVFCLMGPTAVGKTELACSIVQHFPCEIISVDSAMVYRQMDIGTAKPDARILAQAPHHLIDIINPDDSYSVAQFCDDVASQCIQIHQRGKIPLLVGGTMMYFHALQQGLAVLPEADEKIRSQLLQQAQEKGWQYLHQQLREVDPVSAAKIHQHDTQRLQRALEVYLLTGRSLSDNISAAKHESQIATQFINFILLPESRAWLHERIGLRFEQMLHQGLIAEVEKLVAQWSLTSTHVSMRCVGYRQVFDYLHGAYDKKTLLDKGTVATRQLAKRQLTWLRHWPNGCIFTAENPAVGKEIMTKIDEMQILN